MSLILIISILNTPLTPHPNVVEEAPGGSKNHYDLIRMMLMVLMILMMMMILVMLMMMMMLMMVMMLMMLMMLMMVAGWANACPSPLPREEGSDTEQMRSRRGCNIVLRDGGDMFTMAGITLYLRISMVCELEQVDKLINNPG